MAYQVASSDLSIRDADNSRLQRWIYQLFYLLSPTLDQMKPQPIARKNYQPDY
jgi:hypothetical protein